jgi:hypothetical protein
LLARALLLLAVAAAGSASGQDQGPVPTGPPPGPGVAAPRFEAGVAYGFAVFTGRRDGVSWYDDAPVSADMDLETSPSLGAGFAWAAGAHLRVGARAARQETRLLVTDEAGATSRTDLVLWHLDLELELAFGGGASRPVLTLGGGGALARAEDGSGQEWHGAAALAPRWAVRVLVRAPVIWVGGDPVVQVVPTAGAAFLF